MSPNSRLWELVRDVENHMAVLADVEGNRKVIEEQSLFEGSYDAIYDEAIAMIAPLKKLKLLFNRLRGELAKSVEGESKQ